MNLLENKEIVRIIDSHGIKCILLGTTLIFEDGICENDQIDISRINTKSKLLAWLGY